MTETVDTTAKGAPPAASRASVAFVGFSTESPHHSRGNVYLADSTRMLRRQGIPSRLFHVHLTATSGEENLRRVERLVERLVSERCRWAVFDEVWTPELGRRLLDAGIGVIETRAHTLDGALFCRDKDLLAHVRDCATEEALDEYADLVEIVGPPQPRPVSSIDLRLSHSCGYKRTLADNEFYRDVLDAPEVATHRGCAYCLSARPESSSTAEDLAVEILERIRSDRRMFPAVDTIWMAFAETYYDALAIAFRNTQGDPAWQGLTLSMQCRPDVIARRAEEIEALAADAAKCGTRVRIGVAGFENFSPREILVLNRGAAPEYLDAAAAILNRWSEQEPAGLVVKGFTPSFILFTPWTRIEDLEINLERIARHGLWQANIERLRIGPGTPAFAKAWRDGLILDGPVRPAAHPNGYSSEREFRFIDARVEAISAGFERLRPFALSEQPELLGNILATVVEAPRADAIDWNEVADAWEEIRTTAGGS
jgi:hypothetical protein